jgi:hypothetical protein
VRSGEVVVHCSRGSKKNSKKLHGREIRPTAHGTIHVLN